MRVTLWIFGVLSISIGVFIFFASSRDARPVDRNSQYTVVVPELMPSIVQPIAPSLHEPSIDPVPVSVEPMISPSDQAAVSDLFEAQTRDQLWADQAENAIRRETGGNYLVSCRQIMCRVSIPAPFPGDTAEQNAMMFTSRLPPSLSYNQYTATLASDVRGKLLTFYVTRTDMADTTP